MLSSHPPTLESLLDKGDTPLYPRQRGLASLHSPNQLMKLDVVCPLAGNDGGARLSHSSFESFRMSGKERPFAPQPPSGRFREADSLGMTWADGPSAGRQAFARPFGKLRTQLSYGVECQEM